jgi:CheY-like chemotaxis protein
VALDRDLTNRREANPRSHGPRQGAERWLLIRQCRCSSSMTTAPWSASSAICCDNSGFSDVDDANDGAAALAKMHAKRYGLVISDWNMEPMSGYDLLREVRADPALGQTPFIMVTARATENVSLWPIVFSNSGSGCQALYDHPCRAHCSLRGRGVPSA